MSIVAKHFQSLLVPAKKYLTLDTVEEVNQNPEKGWAGNRSAGKNFRLIKLSLLNYFLTTLEYRYPLSIRFHLLSVQI